MPQPGPHTSLIENNGPSSYRSFAEIGDDNHVLIHVPSSDNDNNMSWRPYMQDLDEFFINLYKFHQKNGFLCLICWQVIELGQIVYAVLLPVFFLNYVDYDILFGNNRQKNPNPNGKVYIYDVIKSYDSVTIPSIQLFAITLAFIFFMWKVMKTIHSMIVNLSIRQFYKEVLHINDCSSLTWQDVQMRIINSKQIFLAQDNHLTELDVHNRILRHTNYMIALINRNALPIQLKVPIIGERLFFTQSFLYNCQLLFFRGPFKCIFEHNWLISDEVKNASFRQVVAKKLNQKILILALINLALCPILLVWQILYFFYSNAALVKRDPNVLGLRNWSLYARWFCRHFNELEHQLNDRLNHAYKPAKNYMEAFTSPMMEIIARHVRFVTGSTFAVLLLLTIYDEDVIQVVHLLTIITVLWLVWSCAGGFIPPDIPQRFTKVELYEQILQHIHYVPHHYPPFTNQARASMGDLFQYKLVRLLEDLIGTIAVPYIMIRHLRGKSLDIVDFFRNYTVEIAGTGDVCIFSLMNIKENGNPIWQPKSCVTTNKGTLNETVLKTSQTSSRVSRDDDHDMPDDDEQHRSSIRMENVNLNHDDDENNQISYHSGDPGHLSYHNSENRVHRFEEETMRNHAIPLQTEHGKLELSLINFKLQNPSWNPSSETQRDFIHQVTSQAIEQATLRQSNHNQDQHIDLDDNDGPVGSFCSPSNSGLLGKFKSPHPNTDSSTAIGLSTMFLHEHARMPISSHISCSTSSPKQNKTEQDPLL